MAFNWLLVLATLVILFLVFENIKHHIVRKTIKGLFLAILFMLILVIMASFVDLKDYFEPDSTFLRTGNAVIDIFKENVGDVVSIEKVNFSVVPDKTIEYIKDTNLTRKIYKEG